jgi:hypothetical protein
MGTGESRTDNFIISPRNWSGQRYPACLGNILHFEGDQIEGKEIGRACDTYGRDEKLIQDFDRKT